MKPYSWHGYIYALNGDAGWEWVHWSLSKSKKKPLPYIRIYTCMEYLDNAMYYSYIMQCHRAVDSFSCKAPRLSSSEPRMHAGCIFSILRHADSENLIPKETCMPFVKTLGLIGNLYWWLNRSEECHSDSRRWELYSCRIQVQVIHLVALIAASSCINYDITGTV